MRKVICVVGPTGVGKTSLGIKLAQRFDTEIISGDSIQVYRGLDIGSAKVSAEEQATIKHHLIDILELNERYSVYEFQKQARKIMDDLYAQNKLPIVVGGTGLYIKSLIYDYEFQPEISQLPNTYFDSFSNEELYQKLLELDEVAALKTHVNNRQRVVRNLQLIMGSNKTKTEMLQQQSHQPLYDAFIIGLTCERSILYERINKRVDIMFDQGLFEEVDNLVKCPNIFDCQGMQGIGYKEFKEYYEHKIDIEEVREKIQKDTRNFAKRQYTWFNNQLNVRWYDIFEDNFEEKIFKDLEIWRLSDKQEGI